MPESKLCSIEMNRSVQENSAVEDVSESVRVEVKLPECGNYAVKQEMAEALRDQGLSEEAVCRLLHIDSELLQNID